MHTNHSLSSRAQLNLVINGVAVEQVDREDVWREEYKNESARDSIKERGRKTDIANPLSSSLPPCTSSKGEKRQETKQP